jgi:acyl-coenzyme A synthetase/AMP-(fatty) acid ligase
MVPLDSPSSPGALAVASARVPPILAGGRWWTEADTEVLVRRWRAAAIDAIAAGSRFIAAAPQPTPEGVAAVVAASTLPVPTILVEPDPAAWTRLGTLPADTTLLLDEAAHGAGRVAALGCDAVVVRRTARLDEDPLPLREGRGVVIFTSGSTGAPKPVFRTFDALMGAAGARLLALGVEPGGGIAVGTSLAHGWGVTCVMSAMLLGGPLGLLGPVNHRAALATLAMPEFTCWWASAHFADVLGRCAVRGRAVAPRTCVISSRIPRPVYDRFLERFGVPIRQTYSSSETGCLTVDDAPADAVRPETVGPPVDGVDIRIGDDPRAPCSCGTVARIWVQSPWAMAGYGFPPDTERPGLVDGWWPMRDVGSLDADGYLTLAGRLDDCIRTRDGQLVNLAAVATELEELSGVTAAAVIPLDGSTGQSFGAVIETDVSVQTLRARIGDALPAWARPRRLVAVERLPRLGNGKTDRLACRSILDVEAER